jgi:protein TonB
MLNSSHRTLLQALAVSLLLHAVLLGSAVKAFPPPPDVPASVDATLIAAELRGDSSKPPSVAARESLREAARPPLPQPRSVAARQAAVAQPAVIAEAPVNSAPRDNASSAPSAPGPAVRAGVVSATGSAALSGPAPGGGREGPGADDLRQYRLSLATAARRFKHYPALASERGWEGTVELALNVSAISPLPEVVLVRSSGRGVLDAQALKMMTEAARVTTLPEGLKGRDFRILLPVQFSLENDR